MKLLPLAVLICNASLRSRPDFNTVISKLMNLTNANIHAVEIQRQTWGEQIKEALTVNGGDVENATNMDYVM